MGGMIERRRRMVPVLGRFHRPHTGQGCHADENIQNEHAVDEQPSTYPDVTIQHARSHHGCPIIAVRVTVPCSRRMRFIGKACSVQCTPTDPVFWNQARGTARRILIPLEPFVLNEGATLGASRHLVY